ncbi:MAG: DUF6105 family protein [Rhizobiaceae bacterium]
MRAILIWFVVPMGLFWAWFLLSANDMSFGLTMLTRQTHDFAFDFYGKLLGIDPATIPPLVAKACVTDTFLVFGIFAFRRRRAIMEWVKARRAVSAGPAMGEEPQPSV